ncbi:hypothetical protein [Thalassospira sp.]|uniref:hypothetical protein n=1 Tax=Thalassospira sp. TaxID=1912094 RepID=UPI0032EC58D7
MKKLIIPFAAVLGLAACQTTNNVVRDTNVNLLSLAKPSLSVGDSYTYYRNGDKETQTITAENADGFVFTVTEGDDIGCVTEGAGDINPETKWTNCGGSNGTQTITKTGDIWPLKVGNTMTYDITGADDKGTWSATRNCVVDGIAMVTLGTKTVPTYEVVCKDASNTRTWFYSPDNKWPIKFTKVHKKRGLTENFEIDLGQGAS